MEIREAFQTKNVPNCGKSPKGGGGVGAKIKIIYISNVDSLWLREGPEYETDIGEIYAIFGLYMNKIVHMYQFDMI